MPGSDENSILERAIKNMLILMIFIIIVPLLATNT